MLEKLVFTDEWINKVERKYGRLRWYEQPAKYFYATLPEWHELRSEVERLVTSLPLSSQLNKIIGGLHSEMQFRET